MLNLKVFNSIQPIPLDEPVYLTLVKCMDGVDLIMVDTKGNPMALGTILTVRCDGTLQRHAPLRPQCREFQTDVYGRIKLLY